MRAEHAGAFERFQIGDITVDFRQRMQAHFSRVAIDRRAKAALRQPALQRHLPAFEADFVIAAGARFLPLVAAPGGAAAA